MDRGAYPLCRGDGDETSSGGDDGDQIKKAITELVITHYNLVMGRHYTIGSTTGVLSGFSIRFVTTNKTVSRFPKERCRKKSL
ncbi:hypothetical protein RRG08_004406 [Elysia crispata]|uniref:Uncharacterized protein n=1 Tax=Elysia crispata TaxID=231223 RepID=A0AAE1EC29_9GAST|nr:hypothetical protein RRG08_004406 [Elysia crispata]